MRGKRILYTIFGVHLALSLMWFLIYMSDGTESLWFYWPMLGTGFGVAVVAIVMLGIGELFGTSWEQRQIDRYLDRHRGPRSGTTACLTSRTMFKTEGPRAVTIAGLCHHVLDGHSDRPPTSHPRSHA